MTTDKQRIAKLEKIDELIDEAKDKIFDACIILIELGLEPLGDDAGNISCSIDELSALLRDEIDTKPEGDTQS